MKYFEELKKLELPKDMFAVFGSGPLAIRGLRENKDIDLIVKKELCNKLIKEHEVKDSNGECISIGNVDIFKNWKPWFDDIDLLIEDSDIFDEIRFVKLKYVLEFKKSRNKEKDQKDVELIKEFLKKDD